MFEVVMSYPLPSDIMLLEHNDDIATRAAKLRPAYSGCGAVRHGGSFDDCTPRREIGWLVETFNEAIMMKKRLECCDIDGVHVTANEAIGIDS